jgi:hypothetical protein
MELDGFIEIFNPGHKHLREERDRKRIEAQIPKIAGKPFGIDLDGGTAIIRVSRTADGESPDGGSPDDAVPAG